MALSKLWCHPGSRILLIFSSVWFWGIVHSLGADPGLSPLKTPVISHSRRFYLFSSNSLVSLRLAQTAEKCTETFTKMMKVERKWKYPIHIYHEPSASGPSLSSWREYGVIQWRYCIQIRSVGIEPGLFEREVFRCLISEWISGDGKPVSPNEIGEWVVEAVHHLHQPVPVEVEYKLFRRMIHHGEVLKLREIFAFQYRQQPASALVGYRVAASLLVKSLVRYFGEDASATLRNVFKSGNPEVTLAEALKVSLDKDPDALDRWWNLWIASQEKRFLPGRISYTETSEWLDRILRTEIHMTNSPVADITVSVITTRDLPKYYSAGEFSAIMDLKISQLHVLQSIGSPILLPCIDEYLSAFDALKDKRFADFLKRLQAAEKRHLKAQEFAGHVEKFLEVQEFSNEQGITNTEGKEQVGEITAMGAKTGLPDSALVSEFLDKVEKSKSAGSVR